MYDGFSRDALLWTPLDAGLDTGLDVVGHFGRKDGLTTRCTFIATRPVSGNEKYTIGLKRAIIINCLFG